MTTGFQIGLDIDFSSNIQRIAKEIREGYKQIEKIHKEEEKRKLVNADKAILAYKKEQEAKKAAARNYMSWWEAELKKQDKYESDKAKKSKQLAAKNFQDKEKLENQRYQNELRRLSKRQAAEQKALKQEKDNLISSLTIQSQARTKHLVDTEKRIADQLAAVKKTQAEQEKRDAKDLAARNRAEERARKESLREQLRLTRQRNAAERDAYNMSKRASFYSTAAGGAMAATAVKKAMEIEQIKMRLQTQFGADEGLKVFKEMSRYAVQTAFSISDATNLIHNLQLSSRTLGIKNNEQLVDYTKSIGNTILAYGATREDRAEIVTQLSNITMRGFADLRNDIQIIQTRGMPIIQAIEDFTKMSYGALQEKYGARVPAKLVFDALMNLTKSEKVLYNTDARSKSLTQSWDSLVEQTTLFASIYGDVLAKEFDLPEKFKFLTDQLSEAGIQLDNNNTKINESNRNITAMATAFALSIAPIMAIIGGLRIAAGLMGGMSLLARSLLTNFTIAAGIFSAGYLILADWDKVFKSINEKGLSGLLDHMDILIAGAGVLIGILALIPGLGLGIAAAGGVAGVAGYAAYVGYQNYKKDANNAKAISTAYNTNESARALGMNDGVSNFLNLTNPAPQMSVGNPSIYVNTTNTFDPKNYKATSKTRIQDYLGNPLVYQVGE